MTPDPYEHYDAAYVLGSLSSEDRHAFELHLEVCPDCDRAVRQVAGIPGLLAGADPAVLEESASPMPDALLEDVLARRRRERRRRRGLLAGAGACVAAAAAVAAFLLLPAGPGQEPVRSVAFSQVVPSPVHATADLRQETWGTRIDLDCRYEDGSGPRHVAYGLVVTDEDGRHEQVGTWWVSPGESISLTASTRVPVSDIARVDIVGPQGAKLLRATP